MRQRKRPAYSPEELNRLYAVPRQPAECYADHPELANCQNPGLVDELTIAMGLGFGTVASIADMSCGSGEIPRRLGAHSDIEPILGDFGPGWEYHGPISETVQQLPVVDLFVLAQTLEHLDDPDADLALIRAHCRYLLLATSVDEVELVEDHYWSWSRDDVEEMVRAAGFTTSGYIDIDLTAHWYPHCRFGVWALR